MKPRTKWTNDEWDKFAAKLAEDRPERMVAQDVRVTGRELGAAMQATIEKERWIPFDHIRPMKMMTSLKKAYTRLRLKTRQSMEPVVTRIGGDGFEYGTLSPGGIIKWSPEGWGAVAIELNRLHPGIFEDRLQRLRIAYIKEAQQVLPPHLHKDPKALEIPRRGLLKAWDALAEDNKKAAESPEKEALPIDHAEDHQDGGRVQYGLTEWIMLAEEMHRQNPHAGFMESKTLAGLKPADVKPAMRIFPINRRRDVLTVTTFRKPLLEAFAILRQRQEAEKLNGIKAPQGEEIVQPVKQPDINRFEAAVAPMIQLIAEEFMKAALPMVSQMLRDLVAQSLPEKEDSAPPPRSLLAGVVKSLQPKLPRIAIVGNKSIAQQELSKDYPSINFEFVDANRYISKEQIQNCDRVVGMTDFISHKTESVVHKAAGDRYCRVHGGLSSIRRQIDIWVKSGVINSVLQ